MGALKDFIADLSMVNSAKDYKHLIFRDGKYCGKVKLTYISRLFSKYLFRAHYEYCTNTFDYGTLAFFNIFFSGSYDAGHSNILQNNSHTLKPYNVP